MQHIISWAWIPLLKPNYTSDRHFQSFCQRGGQGCAILTRDDGHPNQHEGQRQLPVHSSFTVILKYCNKSCVNLCVSMQRMALFLTSKCKMQLSADISKLMGERQVKIKVRDNTASDNHCFSQSAIKNPRMPNQARLQSYTNQHITATNCIWW